MPAKKNIIGLARQSQSSRPSCTNDMLAQICKPDIYGTLRQKEYIAQFILFDSDMTCTTSYAACIWMVDMIS
jgi:hypothetical protein